MISVCVCIDEGRKCVSGVCVCIEEGRKCVIGVGKRFATKWLNNHQRKNSGRTVGGVRLSFQFLSTAETPVVLSNG